MKESGIPSVIEITGYIHWVVGRMLWAFFDIRNSFYTLNKLKPGFAFPYKTKIFGKFWSNTPHEKKMYESLIFLYSVSKSEWINTVNKWSEILMVHSYNNLIYKKIFKKVGLKINLWLKI